MRTMTALFATLALTAACAQDPIGEEAEDIQEAHEDLVDEALQTPAAGAGAEEQLEYRADVAEAREDLVEELTEMEQTLANLANRADTPEEQQALVALQQRFGILAQRLDSAGAAPEVYEELADEADSLGTDIGTYERGL